MQYYERIIEQTRFIFQCFHLLQLLPQIVFFGFFNTYSNNLIPENHILLLFEIYLRNSRKQEKAKLRKIIRIDAKVKDIEKESAGKYDKKIILYNKKWENIGYILLFQKKHHVSLNNDPNGWGMEFVFCIFAYIKYICFFLFRLYLFAFFILILFFLYF